ncbi:MAG: anaerobic ribonucleoside-triphosphate reductase [Intestinibacter bartlettii]|jgi:ribonucleoside-triphosphate reductase|nr:anaerobic ribonucleoside-triphosphate reductase [Intestinibacter bartlettii]
MVRAVIKRDGRENPFNSEKIYVAVMKAFNEREKKDGNVIPEKEDIAKQIAKEISESSKDKMTVEEIQDIVETKLMKSSRPEVAKDYILYRDKRTVVRDRKNKLVQKVMIRAKSQINEHSNANVDEESFSGREKEASADIGKTIALEYEGLSKEVAEAHKIMLIYQHDLEKAIYGVHNCLNLYFQYIFKHGFKTRNGDVRPPKSFSTACQLVAVAFQCQSQVQFGGVGTIHLDYDLAPFVRMSFSKHFKEGLKWVEHESEEYINHVPDSIGIEDEEAKYHTEAYKYAMEMLEKEGSQSAQGLYHNLNTLESRQGSQVPFTSINLGRDTTPEGRMVTRWMLEASIDGIGKFHLTSIFPISIFQYKVGCNANKEDANYDLKQLALESMSKRIYPNWCNCDWSQAHEDEDNPDTYFSTMGCRTLVGYDRHGLGYIRQGRGNNVPNTIILPKLGIEFGTCLGKRTEPDLKGFWDAFEETLKLCEKGLLERFEIMIEQSPKAAPFMYQNNTIQDAKECKESVYNALKHNTLAIGYIGVAEMCVALFGKNHAEDKKVHEFALSVVKRINEFAAEASERNDLNFSCYATPAEGLCRTALKALREQYGVIKNVTSHEFLTNSHHVPVYQEISIYDKLRVEAPFCKYPTGGCITYVELDSTFVKNLKAVEDIIDYAFKVLDIPYLAFNFPIDSCLDCGYQGEFNDCCPMCHSKHIQQLRRVTGYLTTDWHNFNDGKQAEVQERVKNSAYQDSKDIVEW